jgi:NADPH-dependent curcumin reductase CurA
MSRQTLSIHLAERPDHYIVPGKTFVQRTTPAPTASDLKPDQILIENLYLSLDPAMRGWLNDRRSYVPPVQIGEVMRGGSLARVLASTTPNFKEGDLVSTFGNVWTEVQTLPAAQATLVELPAGARVTDGLGLLGMTGLTAYFGMTEIAQPKAGETVVVSGAAGATGSVAGQVAKIAGARVVGIAGQDEKVRWLKEELGFDVALNYNDPDFKQKFEEAVCFGFLPHVGDVHCVLILSCRRRTILMYSGIMVRAFAVESLSHDYPRNAHEFCTIPNLFRLLGYAQTMRSIIREVKERLSMVC